MLEMTSKLINKDTIFLLTNDLNGNFCYYIPIDTIGADGYFTNQSLNNGYIHISRFDSAQQIISGTFNFTVINSNTKIKHEISEGRFDLRFNY
jgi:hypothetical protein